MIDKLKIKKIIERYNNQPRTCGDVDCNMMILELYEPEAYVKIHKHYKTIMGGARKAKQLFGFASILEFIRHDENYEAIPPKFAMLGDIGAIKDEHCTFLHLGNSYLAITTDDGGNEVFSVVSRDSIDVTTCEFFRRK